MECFRTLGIKPTKNIKEIKRAYSILLKKYHPEEYPEEFKKIHQAYEDALAYAKNKDLFQENILFEESNSSYRINSKDEFKEKYIKELEEKFKIVVDYERKNNEKEDMIYDYFQMIIDDYKKTQAIQKRWFTHTVFVEYCYDYFFIEQYKKIIDLGLYRYINLSEKKMLKEIHDRYYFSNRISKKKYVDLYNRLRYTVYQKRINILMIILLFYLSYLTSLFIFDEFPGFIRIELIMILFYTSSGELIIKDYERFPKIKKWIRKGVPIFIIGCFVLMCIERCGATPKSESPYAKGDYHFEVNDVENIRFIQNNGNVNIISEQENFINIKNEHHMYKVVSDVTIESIGYEGNDCFYVNDKGQLFNTKLKTPIFSINSMYEFMEIVSNEKYCLLLKKQV